MKKRIANETRRIVCTFLAFLLALYGLSAEAIEEAFADESWAPSTGATAYIDGDTCVFGQAIACVASGRETQLAREYDSVELLLEVDAQSSNCGPCDLVLVRSSSHTVGELVAKLEASEGVMFAEPNYIEERQLEDVDDSWQNGSVELHAEEAEQQEDDQEEAKGEPVELQEEDTEEPQFEDVVDAQEAGALASASDDATQHDYTDRQYAFNGEFGIGVPNWNTYDSTGNPTPSVSTAGKVVAVIDSGVDYNHEDLHNAMWSEGESYPTLVALGGGEHGINVAMPRGDGTPYDTTDPMDDVGHGTHLAGIIAGEWNGSGVSGATSGTQIMAIKIVNNINMMSIHEAIQGYRYVIAAQRADVDVVAINNSWNDLVSQ